MNTLCESVVLDHKANVDPAEAHLEEGIKIKPYSVGQSPLSLPPRALELMGRL